VESLQHLVALATFVVWFCNCDEWHFHNICTSRFKQAAKRFVLRDGPSNNDGPAIKRRGHD
jgi:hypothetical protein